MQDHARMQLPGAILVVDDDPDMCALLEAMLRAVEPREIITVNSGRAAIEFLERLDGDTEALGVDLILLDLLMPDMDGLETCKKIKADPRLAHIPIVMLTAAAESQRLLSAFAAGVNDYVRKPFEGLELLARIRAAIRLKEESDLRRDRERRLNAVRRQLEIANAELRRLSTRDGLTDVGNRRHFDESLQREWRRAVREGRPLSLVILDVDHFKAFNDHYGHLEGDACLQKVANVLRSCARRPADVVARYGGEEFVALLPGTGLAGACKIAEAVRQRVASLGIPHAGSTVSNVVTVSVGVASRFPRPNQTIEGFVEEADRALYSAKGSGRNRVGVARPLRAAG